MKPSVVAVVTASTLAFVTPGYAAKLESGASCKRINEKRLVNGATLICSKVGKKLIWIDLGKVLAKPSPAPTVTVTALPSPAPTVTVTALPSPAPTVTVTALPSPAPTVTVTAKPSPAPTVTVTALPSPAPTVTVTAKPSPAPTVTVTAKPSPAPTVTVTALPSPSPTPSVSPELVIGKVYSGTLNDEPKWRWIAAEISNASNTHTLNWNYYDALLASSSGVIVDSSFEANFPYLGPGEKSWFVTTQFSSDIATRLFMRKKYSIEGSPLAVMEFPSVSNPRLVPSKYEGFPNRKSVSFVLKNNASKMIMDKYSYASAVIFDASGIPIYATRGSIDKRILPGGTAEVVFGNFTFDRPFSSIEVYVSFREEK